ncbi:MAG: N-acetylmuramoyl-L-alanine amidase [Parabacteroides sp.]|nr:N-acetylmuramoyl-L-alanine amidase [Parabacteroides sp.]
MKNVRGIRKRMTAFVLCLAMMLSILPSQAISAADVTSADEKISTTSVMQLQYVYVDKSHIKAPDTQTIVVSFAQGSQVKDAFITCVKEGDESVVEVAASEIQGNVGKFTIKYDDVSEQGSYCVVSVRAVVDGVARTLLFADAGIECCYGVNQECNTTPDAVVEELDSSSAANDMMSEFAVYSMDSEGELEESNTVEGAQEESDVNTSIIAMGEAAGQSSISAGASSRQLDDKAVIVLDPGHGGKDGGAYYNNIPEKELNLKIAKYCRDALNEYSGVEVYLTRETDQYLWLTERVDYAKSKNADLFVSIHLNASTNSSTHGAEVYYPNGNYNAVAGYEGSGVARSIQNELVSLGIYDRGIKIRNTTNGSTYPDGSEQDYYTVILCSVEAGFPGLIVEHAFLSNINDYNNFLNSDEKLKELGLADARGIANYMGLEAGNWVQDSGGWKFCYSNGSYQGLGWKQLRGSWYYFDQNGYSQTGWITVGRERYYLNEKGQMQANWVKIGDDWYYFGGSGLMQTGWLQLGITRYYLNSDGKMATGFNKVGDTTYYFDGSGAMLKGWILQGNTWYYFTESGEMATGWLMLGDTKYYLESDGKMVTGWNTIDGEKYYFGKSGNMYTGIHTIDGITYEFDDSGVCIGTIRWEYTSRGWRYKYSDDTYASNGWAEVNGFRYYFDAEGYMKTGWLLLGNTWYYLHNSGEMATGWILVGNTWYYMNSDGKMATGFKKVGNNTYYLDSSGAMVIGWVLQGSTWYYFTESGEMVTGWLMLGNTKYYLESDGKMAVGWKKVDGNEYYLGPNGDMYTGKHTIDGQEYEFDSNGVLVHKPTVLEISQTPIMGISALGSDKEAVVDKMVKMYNSTKKTYPSEVLAEGGAPDIKEFCSILYDEAVYEGVKPEVVFAQAMKETGYLQFGGDVKVEQFNFSGLGATGGVPGEAFPDVKTGLQAQVQHLKAYASTEKLKGICVDSRFSHVARGCAPYIEWLGIQENPSGKGWATAKGYGISIVNDYIKPMMKCD